MLCNSSGVTGRAAGGVPADKQPAHEPKNKAARIQQTAARLSGGESRIALLRER